jgi:hypothetical protein
VAGAVAATLVAAGAFADVFAASILVRIAGFLALLMWIAAAALYSRTIGTPIQRVDESKVVDAASFVRQALETARRERAIVDHRLRAAQRAAAGAVMVTLATLVLASVVPEDLSAVALILSARGANAAGDACEQPLRGSRLTGALHPSEANSPFITVRVGPKTCRPGVRDLRLRREDVLAVVGR